MAKTHLYSGTEGLTGFEVSWDFVTTYLVGTYVLTIAAAVAVEMGKIGRKSFVYEELFPEMEGVLTQA